MSNWADEDDDESQEDHHKVTPPKRHGSIERYRPGAIRGSQQREVRSEENQGWNSRGRGNVSNGQLRQPRDQPEDLRQKLNAQKQLDPNDLRHRLNQRSREPEPPNSNQAEDHHVGDGDSNDRGKGRNRPSSGRDRHQRVQGRGGNFGAGQGAPRPHPRDNNGHGKSDNAARPLPRPKRNTENFNPSYAPPDMRILAAAPGLKKYNREYTSRDVLVVNDLFCAENDLTIYNKLLKEIEQSGVNPDHLWQSWHNDSHWIADDKLKWKAACPTFHMVLDRIRDYFEMDIKATRLNWYRDSTEWKPFHHDAAAIKPDKAKTQNMTVAVSFGMERDAAFEHAKTKTVISMPQPNGTIYTFGKDVNILWRHGIPQIPPEEYSDQGRISIIAWGWMEQTQI